MIAQNQKSNSLRVETWGTTVFTGWAGEEASTEIERQLCGGGKRVS